MTSLPGNITQVTTSVAPGGHYSPGVVHNGVVYVSGQLPFVPGSAERTVGSIEEQVVQAMRNVEVVLTAAGSDLDHLLSVTIYLSEMEHWARVNAAYAELMGSRKPARAMIPVGKLHYGCDIEIQGVGAVREA